MPSLEISGFFSVGMPAVMHWLLSAVNIVETSFTLQTSASQVRTIFDEISNHQKLWDLSSYIIASSVMIEKSMLQV